MKTILALILIIAAVAMWQKRLTHNQGTDQGFASVPITNATAPKIPDERLIIKYDTDEELLAKLKQIKTYKRLELRDSRPRSISTGLLCTDTAAKEIYRKQKEAILSAINAEFRRIGMLARPPQ